MEKVVKISTIHNHKESIKEDLAYWLSKTPEERISTVEILRRQYYDANTTRLQRVARVTKLS